MLVVDKGRAATERDAEEGLDLPLGRRARRHAQQEHEDKGDGASAHGVARAI
jgi:hypothetical protein